MPTQSAPPPPFNDESPWSLDWTKLIPFILITATLLAYANSLRGGFILDDNDHILNDPTIQALFPISGRFGINDRRPVVKLSLILNYGLGQFDPRGYHLFNLLVHIVAGLALYGVVRRTLLLPRLAARFDRAGPWVAMACALFWMLHPLQTQAVSYIIQRSESMMGMFYLLTLYCAIRTADSARPWLWTLMSLAACALGMLTKEVMISAPLVVLLYDRAFLSSSTLAALRRRPWLYAGLFLPYAIVALLLAMAIGFADMLSTRANAGFAADYCTPAQYAVSQAGVILKVYLPLCFWPGPLCLDYFDWPLPPAGHLAAYWPTISILVLMLGTAAWGVWKRTWWGFLAAAFFLILAPSSSFMPIRDLVMEHRMYLPLACVVVATVIAGWAGFDVAASRLAVGRPACAVAAGLLIVAISIALGVRTGLRNEDYHSEGEIYDSVVGIRPGNPRAWRNLAEALAANKDTELAIPALQKALQLLPDDLEGWKALAMMYLDRNDPAAAAGVYRHLLVLTTNDPMVYFDLAVIELQNNPEDAEKLLSQAIRLKPDLAQAHNNRGLALVMLSQTTEAEHEFRQALLLSTNGSAETHSNLAALLMDLNRIDETIAEYGLALKQDPKNPRVYNNYGEALLKAGRYQDARDALVEAQKLSDKNDAKVNADTARTLGDLAVALGDTALGIKYYRYAMQLEPGVARYLRPLAWVLATGPAAIRDPAQALTLAQSANQATANVVPAYLDTLAAAYAVNGQFTEAAATARRALQQAKDFHQVELATKLPARIAAYDAGRAWVEPAVSQPAETMPR